MEEYTHGMHVISDNVYKAEILVISTFASREEINCFYVEWTRVTTGFCRRKPSTRLEYNMEMLAQIRTTKQYP